MSSTFDTIASSILWIFFGHYSQAFDWLGIYVWMINDFSCSKAITRSLVFMPLFRWFGDIVNKILLNTNPDDLSSSAIPSPLWYLGEIYGDSYLSLKALSLLQKTERKDLWYSYSIYVTFALQSGIYDLKLGLKIAQVITRLTNYGLGTGVVQFYNTVSILDSCICFVGAINDAVCCFVMYKKSNEMLQFGNGQSQFEKVFVLIKQSSVARTSIMLAFKVLNGLFFVTHLCGAFETTCTYGFLRDFITKIDYQFYYMDYLLIRNSTYTSKGQTAAGGKATSGGNGQNSSKKFIHQSPQSLHSPESQI